MQIIVNRIAIISESEETVRKIRVRLGFSFPVYLLYLKQRYWGLDYHY